jgi:hypothetical protein
MRYNTENDRQRMLPGPEGSQYWSPTDWYREAVDVLTEHIDSGERLLAAGKRPNTWDYFKLTSLSREIVAVRDASDEQHYMPSSNTGDAADFTY